MSVASKLAQLFVSNLGRSLGVSGAGTVDVAVSGDAGNLVSLSPNDGGLLVSNAATSKAVLPVVSTSDNGDLLTVVGGAWAKAVPSAPPGLSVIQTDYFTSTSLVSNNGGWKKNAAAKWILVTCIGGGASGYNASSGSYGPGGEAGVLDFLLRPAGDFPGTADVTVGAGGAAPTAANSGNAGSASRFGSMVTAQGGRSINAYNPGPDGGGYNYQTQGWIRGGRPGQTSNNRTVWAMAEDSQLGPGSGGGCASSSQAGSGGAANAGRPSLTVAGGVGNTSTTSSGGAGGNGPQDPFGAGSGGGGAMYQTGSSYTAGAGGYPGGGGGASLWSGNGTYAPAGAGAAGRVCVVQYG